MEEFSKKKYEETSLNEILKKVNMSKGSFYYHFGDKFGLYLAMMDLIAKKKLDFFTPILKKEQEHGDFFGTLKEIIKKTIEFMFIDKRLYYLTILFLESSNDFISKVVEYFPYDYNQGFGTLISQAIKKRQISSKFSQDFIINFLSIIFTNSHKFFTNINSVDDIDCVLDQLINLMQFGFSSKEEDKV